MMLPRVVPSPHKKSDTARPIPAVVTGRAVATDETSILGRILPAPPPDTDTAPPKERDRWSGEPEPPPVKALKAKDGYRSIHSEFTRPSLIRSTMRGTGELLITLGLVVLLFAAYEWWGNPAIVDAHQNQLSQQFDQLADGPDPTVSPVPVPSGAPSAAPTQAVAPGPNPAKVMAKLYIPRLNKSWVIVEGVTQADIRYAPGHYPRSAMPGNQGNFAIAGHRNRATFWDLDQMEQGDKIFVETASSWFTYEMTTEKIVLPTQVEVVQPRPPGESDSSLITITTCNPKLDNYQRLIIHGKLTGSQARSAGKPAGLGG
jgi:sortase A